MSHRKMDNATRNDTSSAMFDIAMDLKIIQIEYANLWWNYMNKKEQRK